MCRRYWSQPQETAAAMRGGWWRNGDLAMTNAGGFLWMGGREKDMIISGAENIYPRSRWSACPTRNGGGGGGVRGAKARDRGG